MNYGDFLNEESQQSYVLFAQDQWTMGRLTLQGAVRYERAWSWSPGGPGIDRAGRFHPTAVVVPQTSVSRLQRHHAARRARLRHFGNGKTSLKVNVGKYLESANNQNRYTLMNPAQPAFRAHDEPGAGTTAVARHQPRLHPGVRSDQLRGQRRVRAVAHAELRRPDVGRRRSTRTSSRVGASGRPTGSSARRFSTRSCRASSAGGRLQPPLVQRLHGDRQPCHGGLGLRPVHLHGAAGMGDAAGGGGYTVTASTRIRDCVASNNYVTFAADYGDHPVLARRRHQLERAAAQRPGLQGGTSTGRGIRDNCEVTAALPEILLVAGTWQRPDSCHVTEPLQTQVRGL